MVYQETNVRFNTNNVSTTPFGDSSGNDVSGNDPWFISYNNTTSSTNSNTCQGSNCCSPGLLYNAGSKKCVELESFQTLLNPATTSSLKSLSRGSSSSSSSIPSPVLGDINKTDNPLISKDLDYNAYKNTTNKNLKDTDTASWNNIMTTVDKLISTKKADYTIGMDSLSSYNS
jgi:hypothetical protein